jgi:hypothetical protein
MKRALAFPGLPPPPAFPPLDQPVSGDDERLLRRYVHVAHDLATSTVLNQQDLGFSVNFGDGMELTGVESRFPTAELVRGLTAGFRQLYAAGEKASFQRAMGVMQSGSEPEGS